jgi:hypothetical protein
MTNLDPVTLDELAVAMRDATWVDARIVPGGVVERVRVEGIIVRRREEEVEFLQVWATEEGRQHQTFTVHAEEVWWIKPTGQHDVTLVSPFNSRVQLELADGDEAHWQAAYAAIARWHRITPDEVRATSKARLDGEMFRYKVMLVVAALSPHLKPSDITKAYGYASPQPLVSARQNANAGKWNVEAWTQLAKEELKQIA